MSPHGPGVPRLRHSHRYGARGVLIELHEGESVYDFSRELRSRACDLVERFVEGETSLLALVRHRELIPDLNAVVSSMPHMIGRRAEEEAEPLVVPTVYSGEDLAAVSDALGMSASAFVDWHTNEDWTVAFEGFAAGFSYLRTSAEFTLPRRDTPRAQVPKGTVALANHYSGIYPRAHSSGWQAVGRTGLDVWDEDREHPAILTPGRAVRFEAVRGEARGRGWSPAASAERSGNSAEAAPGSAHSVAALEIVHCRPGATVQDQGRSNGSKYAISRSGAFDQAALVEGNRALGNAYAAAGIEITNGGFSCRARGHQIVCLTGAEGSSAIMSGGDTWPTAWGEPIALNDGETLTIDSVQRGVRTYLTLRGGVAVEPVLGSRSFDSHSRIGPAPLSAGNIVPVGVPRRNQMVVGPVPHCTQSEELVSIRVSTGPRLESVGAQAYEDLLSRRWVVDSASSRTAIRLLGDPVRCKHSPELPSEALMPGSIQLPPSSIPIVFGVDHPITGGYPVIAVVDEKDIDRLGQLRPGDSFVFEVTDERTQESIS